jgi:Beta-galactosidase
MRSVALSTRVAVVFLYSLSLLAAGRVETSAQTDVPRNSSNSVRLPEVHLDGTYFTRNGKRFIPLGALWVPAKAAMQWPVEWDPTDIDADFAKMHDLGYSIVRLDMMWAWFEPRPGDYNPTAFQQLDHLLSLAHMLHNFSAAEKSARQGLKIDEHRCWLGDLFAGRNLQDTCITSSRRR